MSNFNNKPETEKYHCPHCKWDDTNIEKSVKWLGNPRYNRYPSCEDGFPYEDDIYEDLQEQEIDHTTKLKQKSKNEIDVENETDIEKPKQTKTNQQSGCYLTSACMKHMQEKFDDNCHELQVLRWFRDNFVSKEDICEYYKIAPIIVSNIDQLKDNEKIYDYIYKNIVLACVNAIEIGNYEFAYNRYKNSVLALEEKYAKSTMFCKTKTLKME